MSKLNIDQQTIKELFANKRSDFLIPDYQRPYAWGEAECQTLWDDIFAFAFPENDYSRFKSDEDEYFLGPIVTFKNDDNKLEIIDGQQRLTTLMLLLRAFFSKFGNMKDANAISTSEDIAKCIWKTDEFGNPDKNKLKIDSEVSTDEDKEEFIKRWKELEVICEDIFDAPSGSPMDELFTRYMYYERAKLGIKLTTTEALRKFYEKDKYAILKREETLGNLEKLVQFWKSVLSQDDMIFSDKILRRLAVLNYAPNGMWTYLVSVYFMQYRDENNLLEEQAFDDFLNKIIAFIWTYAFMRPGVNALRSPAYPEMIEIVNDRVVDFEEYRFDADAVLLFPVESFFRSKGLSGKRQFR